jgi:AcrR family transcriptional regulator
MRRKNQGPRKQQLARAAREVLLERGAVGVRVKDVAERAGVSTSSLLYYYPDLDDLLFEVAREAIDRYAERRAAAVREVADPVERLRLAISLGVPTGPEDEESRILYELDAFTGVSPGFGLLTTSFYDRQVALYESLLEYGAAHGRFALTAPAVELARGMVALEDGLGLQVVVGHPGVDREMAEQILLRFAGAVAGVQLRLPAHAS